MQVVGEGYFDFGVDLGLVYVFQFIFYWIFNGYDVVFLGVEVVEGGVECCVFFGVGWIGDQDDVVWVGDQCIDLIEQGGWYVQCQQIQVDVVFVQQMQDDVFVVVGGQGGDVYVDCLFVDVQCYVVILRDLFFGNVQIGYYFDV